MGKLTPLRPMRKRDNANIPTLKARRRQMRHDGTAAEAVLWKFLQRRQLLGKKFRRQYSIGSYILDFFCFECDLAIELDGAPHFRDSLNDEYDLRRAEFLKEQGIRVIRFENKRLYQDVQAVLAEIREAVRSQERSAHPGRPFRLVDGED